MIAWSTTTLDNLEIQAETENALRKQCITTETAAAIKLAHPVNLYTPNPVIRVGLFILTVIVVSFGVLLLGLMMMDQLEHTYRGLLIFSGLACYGALELAIRGKGIYHAGINEALLWGSMLLIVIGITIDLKDDPSLTVCAGVTFILTLLATLRFADSLSAATAFLSFLTLVFIQVMKLGTTGKMIMPFVIMGISLASYLLMRALHKQTICRHYRDSITIVAIIALITLYLAGNYYVVRETSNVMFNMELQPGQGIPGGWIFWVLTILIPPVYLYLGIRKKDVLLLRTGLILLAMIVFTVRYYHSIMPLETAMLLAGAVLAGGAWALIRYLHTPKHGFTYAEADEPGLADKLQVESLIVAQTFNPASQAPVNNPTFGGGSGGGGGASGEF